MQNEQQWVNTEDDVSEAYAYFMRTDPEMREMLGPIEELYDPLTKTYMKSRLAKVGMVRGGPENMMKEVRVYLHPVPHIRIEKAKDLQGWYQPKHNDKQGSRARPCMTDAVLTEPYGGTCTVGCAFCYINSGFRGYRGAGLVTVPIDYGAQVEQMLGKMRTSAAGYFSSFTDPFLPLEDVYHNTRRGAQAFVKQGLPVFFLSRLHYPAWAVDMLGKNKYSYAQKSLNTGDDDDWQKLSPGAIKLQEHIDEVAELRKRGIYTSIQVNPIIPGVTDHDDIRKLFERLAEVGNNHVIVKFVEAGYSWAGAMVERIEKRFGGNRAGVFKSLFQENSAGAQKTIVEEYRMEAHRLYQKWATELGMTYATCYEYRKDPQRGWISVGPEFTTADQCHGKRVPMFTRLDTAVPFSEVAECPPAGCLSCGDKDPEGRGACGSLLFGAAKSNRLPDLRKSVYDKEARP